MTTPGTILHAVSAVSIAAALLSTVVVLGDLSAGNQQHMWIMDVVWPLTTLWSGPLGLAAYYTLGRRGTARAVTAASLRHEPPPGTQAPFWQQVALAATHCGSGCALGDMAAEALMVAAPLVLFGSPVFATWTVDFVFAFVLGIGFQYFTIAPMRGLHLAAGLRAAVKADSASLVAWQVGMYGWMAVALFVLYSPAALPKSGPEFWFMMQVAMCAGFVTTYPVNWALLRLGVKEAM